MILRGWNGEKRWLRAFLLIVLLFSFTGCIGKNNIEVTLKNPKKPTAESLNITISNVQVINHQIVITGTNLSSVNDFRIKEGSTTTNLQIESQTQTSLIANTISNVTFATGKVFDFIFSNAMGASTFTVDFSLCHSSLGGKAFDCLTAPLDKQVLSYDQASGKWKPRDVNGLNYIGTFDASSGANPAIKPAGQYFIISVAGDIDAGATILGVGDWLVSNGVVWQKIDNSTVITSVFNRTGAVVATKGDYSLTQLSDATITGPLSNQVLKYNGTNWVNSDLSALGGGTVTSVSGNAPISVATGTSTPAISISKADTATNGYLSSADWTTFSGKQNAIIAGTTAQYYRGDKSWQTLDTSAVPENGKLYFTNALALGVPLTGFLASNAVIDGNDTILQAFGKAQGQITALGTSSNTNYLVKTLAAPDTLASTVTLTGVINATNASSITVANAPIGMTEVTNKSYVDNSWVTGASKTYNTTSAGVGIGTSTPAITSLLDITSTTKGVLIPRMTSIERDLIASPDEGLQVYNTTTHALNFYYGGWKELGTASGNITGNAATVTTNANLTGPITSVGNATSITNASIDLTTKVAGVLPVANGGTGSATQNFVDLTAGQTIAGIKTFSSSIVGNITGNAATVTTNANLTGPITSVGNATTITDGAVTLGKFSATGTPDATKYLKGNDTWAIFATDVRAVLLDGFAVVASATVGAGDSILSAIEKLQAQISALGASVTSLGSTKLDKTGGTLSVGTIDGVPNPTSASQVANKAYVDSATQTPSAYSPSCPTGYVSVPAIAYYPGPSFCVMKWEAKTGSNVVAATTAAAGFPVVSINRDNARASCRLIGPGYDLISNAQWQTIARNIADQASNWESGTLYGTQLNRGHSDNDPVNSLAADVDTSPCIGTNQTCDQSTWDSQRRTHTLSNGEIIWDFGGNVWEWVTDNSVAAAGIDDYISKQNAGDRKQISYGNDQFCATPGVTPYCGMGHGWINYSAGAVIRGGAWVNVVNAGVFAASLSYAPTLVSASFGFRCVFVP